MTYRLMYATAAAAACLAGLAIASAASAQEDAMYGGFYVGANLGGSWGNTTTSVSATTASGSTVPAGDLAAIAATGNKDYDTSVDFTGGGEAGYNYVNGALLLGVETDFDAFLVDQKRANTITSAVQVNPGPTQSFTLSQHASTEWLWTARARVGYVYGPWLFYGTGGLALSDVKNETSYTDTRGNAATISASNTKTGWTAGVGGAYAFTPNWSVKAEWLYTDLGDVSATAKSSTGFASFTSTAQLRAHLIRMGVDYRF